MFPAGDYVPLTQDPAGWVQHLLLPWTTLAVVIAATYSRLTRSSLLEVLGKDYIRTARSKGLSESRVVYRHGLRSALTPVVTQLGIDLGGLLGGVIVTEQVFGLPGLGQLAWQSVTTQDLPVIIGTVLVASAFIVVANLLVDLGYALLDPRVRPS
jgi:peptide/nickel transport system permease protein